MRDSEGQTERGEVSRLLVAWRRGDAEALEALIPIVYDHLRRLARGYLRGDRARRFFQTTEIVHEAFLRLVGSEVPFEDRNHFFVVAARTMRRILVDHARRHQAQKREGVVEEVPLLESDLPQERPLNVLALDDALAAFADLDPRKSQVVELKYFAGLTIAETAEVLAISSATVERDLRLAKAWLTSAVLS